MNTTSPLGSCTLVGAGPGDPELLTLKALKAIQRATVLLVDDLVSDEIVAFATPGARIVHVGKRGGCKSTPQAFIEKLMLMAVRDGEDVVRLKGGDPFIFGRGGEEVEHLRAATNGDHDNNRSDTDNDSEHGQESPHAMCIHGQQGHTESFTETVNTRCSLIPGA